MSLIPVLVSIRSAGTLSSIDGQAYTDNLVLDGPAADIGIAGRAGIAERDYDQTAVVRANLGSALPVAGAIAAGPAVGAALLIFSEILKDPLKDMSKVFYRVTGSWDAPDIYQVDQAVAETPSPGPRRRSRKIPAVDKPAGRVTVAAVQMTSGGDVAANLSAAATLDAGGDARGSAALVVLPENFAFMGRQ